MSPLLIYQNCGGPDASSLGLSSMAVNEQSEITMEVGQPLSLSFPLEQLPLPEKILETYSNQVQWIYVSSLGERTELDETSTQLNFTSLTVADSGTYQARVDHGSLYYLYSYRVLVQEPLEAEASETGTYQQQYVNTTCNPGLATQTTTVADISFSDAQRLCEDFSYETASRGNRAITCSFSGTIFRSIKSTFTRDVFVGQQRPSAGQSYQNLVTLQDLTECQARIQCHYFREAQLTRYPGEGSNMRCQWGGTDISAFDPS